MRRYLAELLGTFFLVLGGIGTAVLAGIYVGPVGVALAFGFILLAMVYAIGPISGCHVNPAVTLAMMLTGKMNRRHAAGYIVAQIVGAVLAALAVWLIARGMPGGYDATEAGLAANGYGDASPAGFGVGAAFLAELVLTFGFVLTFLFVTDARAPVGFAGLAIGSAYALVHLVSIPVTYTSVNPARSIGPALFAGGDALGQLWLFILVPLAGALAAAGVHRAIGTPAEEAISAEEAERALVEERESRVLEGERYVHTEHGEEPRIHH
ncbi:MAG TPA: aquaporin [Kofleriaceae bacterium]|nr:aquaporin [Kofleriaceae bacterium]